MTSAGANPIARLVMGQSVGISHLLREFRALGVCGSDGMRALRALGARKCPGMQPVGAESWYIPSAAEARQHRGDPR